MRGFISGTIAWPLPFIINHGAYYFNFSTLRWGDFAGILIYGTRPVDLLENLFAIAGVFFFLGFLGIVFSYLIPQISSQYYLFKSWFYGIALWFLFFATTVLFKLPHLEIIPLRTAFVNFISASLWGITLGLSLKWFDSRTKLQK